MAIRKSLNLYLIVLLTDIIQSGVIKVVKIINKIDIPSIPILKLIKPFRAKINLIPFNPWPGSNYKASSPDQINIFKKFILEKGELVATVRLPRGDDVLAACGQLKSF